MAFELLLAHEPGLIGTGAASQFENLKVAAWGSPREPADMRGSRFPGNSAWMMQLRRPQSRNQTSSHESMVLPPHMGRHLCVPGEE